jgi:hypothetical protein
MMKGAVPLVALLVIGIIAVAGLSIAGYLPATFVAGGFTITSIDDVNVIVNNQPNPAGYFRVTAVADRGSESIYGTVSPQDFKQETGIETEKAFGITLSGLKETARYQVDNYDPMTVYYLEYDWGDCTTKGADWSCTSDNLCVYKRYWMITADIDLPSIKSEVDVTAQVGTKSEKVSISSDSPSGRFSFGNVKWIGGLMTGNQPPSANDYVATFDTKFAKQWRIIRKSNMEYQLYLTERASIESYLNLVCKELFADTNVIRNKIHNFQNAYVNFKAQDATFGEGFKWSSRNSQSGAVTLDYGLPIYTMNPELLFTIDADEVGIKISVGEPYIVSATSPEFNSGDLQGVINIQARNVGTAPGSFSFSLTDCNSFSQAYSVTGEQFSAGQTRSINLPIKTVNSAVETKETCNVKMCDDSGFGKCVSKPVDIHMLEARVCTEGKQIIEGRCIKECKDNDWVAIQCCSDAQQIGINPLTGNYECQEGEGGGSLPDILGIIGKYAGLFIAGLVISFVILLALVILALFIPGLAFLKFLKNWKMFLLLMFAFAIVLMLIAGALVGQVYVAYLANIV